MAAIEQTAKASASRREATTPADPSKLYLENTLLRITGAIFRHDARRPSSSASEIVVAGANPEKTITVRPDPVIGQPGPLAHKLFFALIKKHSDYGLPVRGQVSFSKREIMQLIGRKSWGGRDSEQLSRALHEIHHTFVKAYFKGANGRWFEHSFTVFPEILVERREVASDPIEACTVTIAEPILASLRDEHFTCLNHALMTQLSTIGQAIYVRLFFHFANLYDGTNSAALAFLKRYDRICAEWLGGLSARAHRSQLVEQLGPHLDQLRAIGFLSGCNIAKAKGQPGFVLTFRPGQAFFDDYARFYRRSTRTGDRKAALPQKAETDETLRAAYCFAERLNSRPTGSIAFVTSKDKETARRLLEHISLAEMPSFIDYALAEAKRTNFDVQTIGGIKQYLGPYLVARERQEAVKARSGAIATTNSQEAERHAQEAQKQLVARRYFDRLPKAVQDGIRAEAVARARKFSGSLGERMTDHHIAQITATRYSDAISKAS